MAHVIIVDVSINVGCIVTSRFEVSPEGEPVLIVVNHLDAIGIDDLLLLEIPPGVLGHLLVLLEPVASLTELKTLKIPDIECGTFGAHSYDIPMAKLVDLFSKLKMC